MTDAEEAIYEHPTASDTIIEDSHFRVSKQTACKAFISCISLQKQTKSQHLHVERCSFLERRSDKPWVFENLKTSSRTLRHARSSTGTGHAACCGSFGRRVC